MTVIKDDDGVPLKPGDYFTFAFGIPPTCVTCQITEGKNGLGYQLAHPDDVQPRSGDLADLMKYYQVWKASKQRVAAVLRVYSQTPPTPTEGGKP